MKAASAYKALCQEEKLLLSRIAEGVASLVTNAKARGHFQKQLQEYAEKWQAFKTASEARRRGTWQPEMGQPGNPLDAIWPRSGGASRLPSCGDKPVLGAYAMLAVIHDQVLPQCPSLATEVLSEELAGTIWRDLVTGANKEARVVSPDATSQARLVIPTGRIEAFLRDVKADIESHTAPKSVEHGRMWPRYPCDPKRRDTELVSVTADFVSDFTAVIRTRPRVEDWNPDRPNWETVTAHMVKFHGGDAEAVKRLDLDQVYQRLATVDPPPCAKSTAHESIVAFNLSAPVTNPLAAGKNTLKDRFTFAPGQAMFDGQDLGLPSGLPVDVLKKLVESQGVTVAYQTLDEYSSEGEAREALRAAKVAIAGALRKHQVPVTIETKKRQGYVLKAVVATHRRYT